VRANTIYANGLGSCLSMFLAFRSSVLDNNVYHNSAGIELVRGERNVVSNNNVHGHHADGIVIWESDRNRVGDNHISGNGSAGVRQISIRATSEENVIEGNVITGNTIGVVIARGMKFFLVPTGSIASKLRDNIIA